MKKEFLMTLAAVSLVVGLSANAPAATPAAAPVAQQQEKSASNLSADELAFAAKLNDQNRKAFASFSAEQRKAAMGASCASGTCATSQKAALAPNDAVQKVMKDTSVAVEKKEAPQAASANKAAPQAK
jgi:hypothetical protein